MDYTKITATFRALALEAGDRIMEVYGRPDFEVICKSDDSPVTEADLSADRVITEGLRAALPDIPVVTEEQRASHGLSADIFILVDPLDGTKEFIRRRGDFTVNIALIERGVPTRGVVYAPARNRLFYTCARGDSLEEGGTHGAGEVGPITYVRVAKPDPEALVVVASKSHRDRATDDYISRYPVAEFRSAGSSLKFCLVATGEADFYPRLGRTMEWDTAAGDAVLRGAGGSVVRFDDHTPLSYGKAGYVNPFFIASSPLVGLIAG